MVLAWIKCNQDDFCGGLMENKRLKRAYEIYKWRQGLVTSDGESDENGSILKLKLSRHLGSDWFCFILHLIKKPRNAGFF